MISIMGKWREIIKIIEPMISIMGGMDKKLKRAHDFQSWVE
jgi:hypothetical protein